MSDSWLVLMVAGLFLDIAGVIILVGPLLRYNFKKDSSYIQSIEKSRDILKKASQKFKAAQKDPPPSHPTVNYDFYSDYQIARINFEHFDFVFEQLKKEYSNYKEGKIGVAILSLGFVLQIISNMIR